MIKKISNAINAAKEAFSQDVSIEDINKSKIDFYKDFSYDRYDNTMVYIVSYRDYDNSVNWGPFSTMEHAQNWNKKLAENFNMKAQVVSVLSPDSDPLLWML